MPDEKVYRNYAEHKKILLPELYKTAKEYGKNTAIGTSRKDVHYRFIEPLIRLEEQGYIKIHELNMTMDNIGLNQYRAAIRIEEKLTKQSKYAKSEKFHAGLIDLPEGAQWREIHLVLYENYDIKIKFGDETFNSNCEKFGFTDTRKNKIELKKCWDLFLLLANGNGIFPVKNLSKSKKIEYQKRKTELAKILKTAFPQITGDPFEKWDDHKEEYEIKIHLTPTEDFRDDFRDRKIKESDPHADFGDYLADQTHAR